MSAEITSINYCPVKSVSFQSVQNCKIQKNIGIIGDRIFAFAKGLDQGQAKLFEKSPDERKGKWNKILTLKNSPALNKYNFEFKDKKLYLFKTGEFFRVKILFHLPFLSSGLFSINLAWSKSNSLVNANILSPVIPIFFLISHSLTLWKDIDFTGQ